MLLIKYSGIAQALAVANQDTIPGREEASRGGSNHFTGTKSWEETLTLINKGDKDSFKKIQKQKVQLKEFQNALITQNHRKPENRVAGFMPNVPNYLLGLPDSMINLAPITKKHRVIRIFYNRSVSGSQSSKVLVKQGLLVASLVQALEQRSHRVELWIGATEMANIPHKGKDVMGWFTRFKLATQPLNMYQLAFHLINPSFLRRLDFAILEREERFPDITGQGYGEVNNLETQRKSVAKAVGNGLVLDTHNLEELEKLIKDTDKFDLGEYLTKAGVIDE